MSATFNTVFTGRVHGGPCPKCRRYGDLHAHHGVYGEGGTRTVVHSDNETGVSECTLPIGHGWLFVTPDGVWTYRADDSIPLSDQAVHHLSPGCKCGWSSFPADGTVGITQRHPECKTHPTPKGSKP